MVNELISQQPERSAGEAWQQWSEAGQLLFCCSAGVAAVWDTVPALSAIVAQDLATLTSRVSKVLHLWCKKLPVWIGISVWVCCGYALRVCETMMVVAAVLPKYIMMNVGLTPLCCGQQQRLVTTLTPSWVCCPPPAGVLQPLYSYSNPMIV